MNGSVIFVITIPTASEEKRLADEFLLRTLDLQSEQNDVTSTTTTPIITKRVNSGVINIEDADSNSAKTQILQNYDTFPKRRKSVPVNTTTATLHNYNLTPITHINIDGGSLDDVAVDVDSNSDVAASAPIMRKSLEGLRDILASVKHKSQKKKDVDLNLTYDTAMEQVLSEILRKFQILNAVWTKDIAGRLLQVTFSIEFDEIYENMLEKLHEWGIGEREGSTVSVMNCIASKTFERKNDFESNDFESDISAQKQGAWDRFMNTVRSRLNVTQIVRNVRQDAAITFDFVILLISAAILASFGLIENSTIFLASSMLISPLMGPIIAGIFGTVIKDRSLRTIGLRNELFGILVATVVGFIFGLVVCATDERYGIGDGLTNEMLSRCEFHSLVVGVFTAIPSGAAAAVGILGGNIGSLVGVAISASLLPPAVNSGLLWALAVVYKFFEDDESRYSNVIKTNTYSNNQATELAILGSVSMCLTLINILCIYVVGILVLKVKEIAPAIGRNGRTDGFWKHDIKIARNLTKNGYMYTDAEIIDQFANLPQEDQQVLGINTDILRKLDEENYHHTWSPLSNRHVLDAQNELDNYKTVHRIEKLYSTITGHQPMQEKWRHFTNTRRPTGRTSDIGGTTYKLLPENLPRCATMPTKVNVNPIKVDQHSSPTASSTSTVKGGKFTVTLASECSLKDSGTTYDQK